MSVVAFQRFPAHCHIRYRVRGLKRLSKWEPFGSVHLAELLFGKCSECTYSRIAWLTVRGRGLVVRLWFDVNKSDRDIVDWSAEFDGDGQLLWELFVRQHCPQASPVP